MARSPPLSAPKDAPTSDSTSSRRFRFKRHHHRHHRRKRPAPSPSPPPTGPPPLSPSAAFRESLFDALADDEGAAYWEGVYGQPVHEYSNERVGPDGELERMSDEQYATFVRRRMWEKSTEGLREEMRERKRESRRREEIREERRREREEERRREHRKRKNEPGVSGDWKEQPRTDVTDDWTRIREQLDRRKIYQDKWKALTTNPEAWKANPPASVIPWPVPTGRLVNVTPQAVETFLVSGTSGDEDRNAMLKMERVRWHPDKMQQRFGAEKMSVQVSKAVTAVFQVVDQLWTKRKDG
ncbi:MAG: hypothetical protein M1814_002452 [Vezdaea aestivalis]|nr:MAG: hypothetical protein M1814_002452 [Vezdaea aestivalis]